jgi:hypothetical protein
LASRDAGADLGAEAISLDAQGAKGLGGDAVAFGDEARQRVGGGEVVGTEADGPEAGQGHGAASLIRKAFRHRPTLQGRQQYRRPSEQPLARLRAGSGILAAAVAGG